MSEIARDLERFPYRPPRWLRGPHAQTCWSPVMRPREQLQWRLERLATPDDDFVRLHWLEGVGPTPDVGGSGGQAGTKDGSGAQRSGPTVLLLHGLEGSVASNYIGGQAARFWRRGWSVVVMEFRTCGGEMNRARRMYHLGETSDLDHVVAYVANEIDRGAVPGPLLLSGVSLGGNVLTKWLGEAPERLSSVVGGAAAVSLPFDLEISGPAIDQALFGFYTWRFLRSLRRKAIEKERQFPGCVEIDRIRSARTFVDFDTHGTARLHGFKDAWDYWRQSSCGQVLSRIETPLLLLAAQDDPFNPGAAIPFDAIAANPWIVGQFPERGGHVGFVEGHPFRTTHWSEQQVERFFAGLSS